MKKNFKYILIFICLVSCSDDNGPGFNPNEEFNNLTRGSGSFEYNYSQSSFSKTLSVFYFIPENLVEETPILLVFHGANRNASTYRDALINKATEKGVIVIVPEFSEVAFPGGNAYNLGNVYQNGEQPSPETQNLEPDWTFSIIEPLFDFVRIQLQNTNTTYAMYGHSAGAQFVHRFLLFKPENRVEKSVVSAAGWYTFPNKNINFPYGLKNSILENRSTASFFEETIFVQVGENDNNPNETGLRRNTQADLQGIHRLERATNFFGFASQKAAQENHIFNWSFHSISNANHNLIPASQNAFDLLYN